MELPEELKPELVFQVGENVVAVIKADPEAVPVVQGLAERLRAELGPNITFVLLTGSATMDLLSEAKMAEMGWVPAPAEISEHETGVDPDQLP